MLGLADQVGRDILRIGSGVGEDRDLGRASFGVDADDALEQPLGGGNIDIARSGHEADRFADVLAVGEAVCQCGDRLGAAHGIHLLDPEQSARGEDARVGVAGELPGGFLLRGARDREGADASELGGHDIHDHRARIDRSTTGDIETDTVDGHPALGDGAAVGDLGGGRVAHLVGVHAAGPVDADLQCRPHVGVELGQRGLERGGGDAQALGAHPVILLGEVFERFGAALADRCADGFDRMQCRVDIELRPGQALAKLAQGQGSATQIQSLHHGGQSRLPAAMTSPAFQAGGLS